MRYFLSIILSFFLLAFANVFCHAQVQVTATLDSTEMFIADQFRLHLKTTQPKNSSIESIDISALQAVENLTIEVETDWDTTSNDNFLILEKDFTLQVFDSGFYWIPEIPFIFLENGNQQEYKTNRIPFTVLPAPQPDNPEQLEQESGLAKNKGIILEKANWRDYIIFALPFLTLAFLILVFYILFLNEKQKNAPPPRKIKLPAHTTALAALTQLKKEELWQKGEIKTYQSRLTHIIREYLENRYNIPALESTTDQILRQLKQVNFADQWKEKLRNILQVADLVKFAKAEPAADFHEKVWLEADDFVNKTKEIKHTPEEEEIFGLIAKGELTGFIQEEEITPASFLERALALVIDTFASLAIASFLGVLLAVLLYQLEEFNTLVEYYLPIGILLLLFSLWIYNAYFEYKIGATIGKVFAGIKVTDLEYQSTSFIQTSIRAFGKLISDVLAGLGYLLYFFDEKKQNRTLHDRLAKTTVLKYKSVEPVYKYFNQTAIYAGFLPRFVANMIDSFLAIAISFLPFALTFLGFTSGIRNFYQNPELGFTQLLEGEVEVSWSIVIVAFLLMLLTIWFYYVIPEYRYGATPGKKFMGIQLRTEQFKKLSLKNINIRFFAKFLSLIFGIGYLMYFFNRPKHQTLHDKLAKTIVVKSEIPQIEDKFSQIVKGN